jgi:hydrogenase expression/formation protein HypD
MGCGEYEPIARRYRVPVVITGFEPIDLLQGILLTVEQLEAGEARVENAYGRAVRTEGNRQSQRLLEDVFEVCDRKWRGVGPIPKSGFKLRYEYREHDAERLFEVDDIETQEAAVCISGQVLKGLRKPHECPAFGRECTPHTPLGATMVSSEGACAAYFVYGRHLEAGKTNRLLPVGLDLVGGR